jgi:hypothetical protein
MLYPSFVRCWASRRSREMLFHSKFHNKRIGAGTILIITTGGNVWHNPI